MRLYHGINIDFSEIDLAKSFPLKDFGQGFYLTTIREQAERMAKRKHEALGGKAIVQEYEFDESFLHKGDLKVLIFEGTTPEWATFIFNNRSRNKNLVKKVSILSYYHPLILKIISFWTWKKGRQ